MHRESVSRRELNRMVHEERDRRNRERNRIHRQVNWRVPCLLRAMDDTAYRPDPRYSKAYLNHRPRAIRGHRSPCEIFTAGRPYARTFTRPKRKEAYDWIRANGSWVGPRDIVHWQVLGSDHGTSFIGRDL